MKKIALVMVISSIAWFSCSKQDETGPDTPSRKIDVSHFITTETYGIPVREGCISIVKIDGIKIAETDRPMDILIPKQTGPDKVSVSYIPKDQYPDFSVPKSKLYQTICFEDSKTPDYDYNDLVFHVKYQTIGNIFGFAMQPIAMGSNKQRIRLGFRVYKGSTRIYDDYMHREDNARVLYYGSQSGYINTVGTKANQLHNQHRYLPSTIRNWDMSKYQINGPGRVEWYIEVDNFLKVCSPSDSFPEQFFDKNGLPYGLVFSSPGTEYADGTGHGQDGFSYPQEQVHIKDAYPDLWKWMTDEHYSIDFNSLNTQTTPANAFPAVDLGLFSAPEVDICNPKYLQNPN